jgi:hypothetical protein
LSKSGKPHGFWDGTEKLEVVSETTATARYRSRHKRQHNGKNDKIEVAHLWVLLLN